MSRIVGRNLAKAYFQNLRPLTVIVYARLGRPEIARDRKELKSWCGERAKKPLYELQIEMCRWAIAELNAADFGHWVSGLRRRAWLAAIEAQIGSLQKSKKSVPFSGFGPEELVPYSRERAAGLRKEKR